MIGYVTIGALDVEKAMPFYDAVLGAIGYERQFFDGGWAGYGLKGQDATTFICPPFDGQAARGGNGVMIAFKGESKEAVQAAHAAALAQGGADEGVPGQGPPTPPASTAPICVTRPATSSRSSPRAEPRARRAIRDRHRGRS